MKKVLFVVSIVMLLLVIMAIPAFAAPAEKVDVCHSTSSDNNAWVLISISDNAWETHYNHGDAKPGDPVPGVPGYVLDDSCNPVPTPCVQFYFSYYADLGASNPYYLGGQTAHYNDDTCTAGGGTWNYWVWAVWAETLAEAQAICGGGGIWSSTPTPNLWIGNNCTP